MDAEDILGMEVPELAEPTVQDQGHDTKPKSKSRSVAGKSKGVSWSCNICLRRHGPWDEALQEAQPHC